MTPINHHLVGPEIAYIVNDSDAKVLVGHERFADALAAAATEIKLDADRASPSARSRAGGPFAELTDGQPDTARRIAPPARRCTTRRARRASRRA